MLKKDSDDYSTWIAITKSIIPMMDVNQQRVIGMIANGFSSKVVDKISKLALSLMDLQQLKDEQIKYSNLKRANIMEQADVVRDELSDGKIRFGGCI